MGSIPRTTHTHTLFPWQVLPGGFTPEYGLFSSKVWDLLQGLTQASQALVVLYSLGPFVILLQGLALNSIAQAHLVLLTLTLRKSWN